MENNSEERGFGNVAERETSDDTTENTADEQIEEKPENTQETETEQTDNQENSEENKGETTEDSQESETEEEEGQETTEKGTKLDKNPKSAVHQQLANERRVRSQMERVLADPKLLAKFVKQQYGIDIPVGGEAAQGETKATDTLAVAPKKWTAKDFENIEDVADKFNQLQDTFSKTMSDKDKKIEELQKQVGGVLNNGRMRQIAETTESDVNSLRAAPELNPKSPDYIEGLEGQIAAFYKYLDFDETSGKFRGEHSIREIGEMFLQTARQSRKAGVQRGQTIVKDKTPGKVRTSPGGKVAENTDDLSASASIAKGISKMFR